MKPNHIKQPRYRNSISVWSMRLSITLILSAILILVSVLFLVQIGYAEASVLDTATHSCNPFIQVNDSAFGLGSNDSYNSEEGFEVLTSRGQLYVGMEADNALGARIWRTKSGVPIPSNQADWEEIAADELGKPFGVEEVVQNDHIDSLAEFDGYVYASTANGGGNRLGTRVFRTPSDGSGSWEDSIADYGAGFGSTYNTNFKDMQVFGGYMCGGTQNRQTGSQIWCTADGTNWEQKNVSGFGASSNIRRNAETWSGYVYDDGLYFGVQHLGISTYDDVDDIARMFRTLALDGDPSWVEVYTGEPGSYRVDILGELDDYLYISTRSPEGILIFRSPTGDSNTWVQVNEAGMNGDPNNEGVVVDGAVTYNGALYVAVSNAVTGFELWRTTGDMDDKENLVDWEQVDGSGLGDPKNVHAQLVTFNGYLYAWTSNYQTGQQVLKTECGIEEIIPVTAAGVDYSFSEAVGAKVNFSDLGDVTQITVRAYPGAWDQEGLLVAGVTPVKRHYVISADGNGYSAEVTLSYTQSEFDESSISDENETYQAVWNGSDWVSCPANAQSSDPEGNQVACSGVTNFSKMTITGEGDAAAGDEPNAVTLVEFDGKSNTNPAGYWLASTTLLAVTGLWLNSLKRGQ